MKSGYCTIMWNGRDHGASKMNHHQPHQRVVFSQESDVCMVELERRPLLWAPSGKPDNSFQQVLFPFRPTESKHSKLSRISQEKTTIFDQENVRLHVSLMTRQKLLTAWLESSDWSTLFTRHRDFQCPIYFCLYKILLMEKMKKFLGRL